MMIWFLLWGCGTPEPPQPRVLRSVPRPVPNKNAGKLHVQYQGEAGMKAAGIDPKHEQALDDFFPSKIGIPAALGRLHPGQDEVTARRHLDAVRELRIPMREIGPALSCILRDVPEIQLLVVFNEDRRVQSLDVVLPTNAPQARLRRIWGAPEKGPPPYWRDPSTGLIAELVVPEGEDVRAILRYRLGLPPGAKP